MVDNNRIPKILNQVFKCYEARTARELRELHYSTYTPRASFADPIVVATDQKEAMLQFYSLQKFFSHIEIVPINEPKIEPVDEYELVHDATQKISVVCEMRYEWAKDGFIMKKIMPEATSIKCNVELFLDNDKVVSHTDYWTDPALPALPRPLRVFNAFLTNSIFRVLGWEKELLGTASNTSTAQVTSELKQD